MIEVSGTRTTPREETAAEKLGKVHDETRSRAPLAFGLGLAGLALYLKSFLPGLSGAAQAAEAPQDENAPPPEADPSAPRSARITLADMSADGPSSIPAHETLNYAELVALANVNLPPIGPLPAHLPWIDRSGPLQVHFPSAAEIAVFRPVAVRTSFSPMDFAADIEDGALEGYGTALHVDPPPRNRAPVNRGPVQLNSVASAGILAIALSDLLARSSDEDGDALDVALITASHGRILEGNGGWFYMADANHLGTVEITYLVHDGAFVVEQTAFLTIEARQVRGTDGVDDLKGSAGRDVIDAGAGNDKVDAGAAADRIDAGDGDDKIDAGSGDDIVHAGAGNDFVLGGAGNDAVYGGDGNDTLLGEAGNDTVSGEAGNDEIDGGSGNDLLSGGEGRDNIGGGTGDDTVDGGADADVLAGNAGNDSLAGGSGNDTLLGDDGDDTLLGGDGADALTDGAGADKVDGGAGNDFLVVVIDQSADTFAGGAGSDALDLSRATDALVINLEDETVTYVDTLVDHFMEIETISGGKGNDLVILAGLGTAIAGGGGADTYELAPTGQNSSLSERVIETACQILDFDRDDRVSIASYDIYDRLADALEDQFEDLFDSSGRGGGIDGPRIRYSQELVADIQRTLLEFDYDHDDFYEAQVIIDGFHQLVLVQGV